MSFSVKRTQYGEVSYFYGDDKRGHLFSKWGLNPNALTKPRACTDKKFKDLTDMTNYEGDTVGQTAGMAHKEVGDLVLKTGPA